MTTVICTLPVSRIPKKFVPAAIRKIITVIISLPVSPRPNAAAAYPAPVRAIMGTAMMADNKKNQPTSIPISAFHAFVTK
jgi:hypothetical protein